MQDALFIIDMINDFIDPTGTLYCGKQARAIIKFVKERVIQYTEAGKIAIFVQDLHQKDDPEFQMFPPHAIEGTWGARTIPELRHVATDIGFMSKVSYDGSAALELAKLAYNGKAKIKTVEVVGVCTNICVMDTVAGLFEKGVKSVVPEAGVADFDPEAHEYALKRMALIYGAEIS
jgi:nicotinamidase-related amidase